MEYSINYFILTLLHSERPKLCRILAFLCAIGLRRTEMGTLFWKIKEIWRFNEICCLEGQNKVWFISDTWHLGMVRKLGVTFGLFYPHYYVITSKAFTESLVYALIATIYSWCLSNKSLHISKAGTKVSIGGFHASVRVVGFIPFLG